MKEKFTDELESRKSLMRQNPNLIIELRKKYISKDPAFHLDGSERDLFEREVLREIYGVNYDSWMDRGEEWSLRKLIYKVISDWDVSESRKNPINYNHPEEDERL